MPDVIQITQDLVRFPSVTPDASAAMDYCEEFLSGLGFACTRMVRGTRKDVVDNLYATWGAADNRLLFCGHLDVVPAGDIAAWRHDPFGAVIEDGLLYGRGSVDMKGNIAAYFVALSETLAGLDASKYGLALLLTGDEEGNAVYGVRAVVPELVAAGEAWTGCITGEPTSQQTVGDAYKRGRRGSLNGDLIITGIQGHTGYPARADNAAHRMIDILSELRQMPLDAGNADFEPSWLAISTVDVGNPAGNVIPAKATAHLNFRFNNEQTSNGLMEKTQETVQKFASEDQFSLHWRTPSEPYLSPRSWLTEKLEAAIAATSKVEASATTVGGTSDSRFIHFHCPVVDFGLCGKGMHAVNEAVPIDDLKRLEKIYTALLQTVFVD